ncbi:MAG: hypothetical protein ACJ74Y_05750 [Bryobacteraceae bacterium]
MSISATSSKHASEQAINGDELLRKAAEALQLVPATSIWDDLVSHLGRTLNVDWVFIAKLLPGAETKLRTLAAWNRGHPVEGLDYQLDVPFDDPSMPNLCVYVSNARKHVQNPWLKLVKAQAFGQIRLIGRLGQARGMLAIAHDQALERSDLVEAILRIYAFKAIVELERELADERFYSQLLDTLQRPAPEQH